MEILLSLYINLEKIYIFYYDESLGPWNGDLVESSLISFISV